ncbi:GGDEF domain-containing protein [Pseudenhygromyxa sp. WMMC2535]|uniref:GGDEF domain-containing protein n=1 Tax=Pseudenhygromyxa sp. WMMC2535 TaxID=2712867 RepID=UPI001554D350|nr:GGDEF domain-containing protein [Pseudenhygromyxa sp. WMMC2535]NVB37228.1 GGDEF domain-containing protein [Pseudenhygromyxa sp. WMMC2535]NVB43616.1 GGDEF domain-containing protein [Pseudenhygromyxa sp. WMMC2535]
MPGDMWQAADFRLHKPLARRWAVSGLLLSVGAPTGLWLWMQVFAPDTPPEITHIAMAYSGSATAVVFVIFGWFAGRLMDRLRAAVVRDGLTSLFNRRFLRESLPRMQAEAQRARQPLCALMLDLDHFKRVNDQHGHLVGDQTLRAVAEALQQHSRDADLVSRYGGEEFAVLCPKTDADTGRQVAERLRAAIEALGPEALGHPGPQTVSVGVAVQSPGNRLAPETLLEHADLALYQSKRTGRNRASVWVDGEPATSPT